MTVNVYRQWICNHCQKTEEGFTLPSRWYDFGEYRHFCSEKCYKDHTHTKD